MRLFTGIYPSEEALASIDLALGGVAGLAPIFDPAGPGIRWTPREQRHLTLGFHGEIPDGAVADYVTELEFALANIQPIEIALGGSGIFSGRTLWIGAVAGQEELQKLADIVADAAEALGTSRFVDRRERIRPHMTIAKASARGNAHPKRGRESGRRGRVVGDNNRALQDWARALSVYRGPIWPAEKVCVVASQLGKGAGGGPLHEIIKRIPLANTEHREYRTPRLPVTAI